VLYLSAIVYLAVIYIRPAEIVPSLEGVPVVDVLSVAITLIAAATVFVRRRCLSISAIDGYVLLFWLTIILSNAVWGWFGGAYKGLLDFAPVAFCYFLIRLAVDTPARLRGFVRMLIALNVFLAANGIIQHHTGLGLGNMTTVGLENRIRGTGIFGDPNDLGMTLVMTTPFLLWVVFDRTCRMWHRAIGVTLLAPILTAIVYTNSRGAILGLGGAVCVFAMRQFKPISALTFGVAALLAVVVLGPARAQAMDSEESSAQSRIEAWGEGLMMLKSKPIFGVGYSRFTEYHYRVAHNSFVQTAAELGLVGASIFVAMFEGLFHALRRARRASSRTEALPPSWINSMTSSACGMVICGFFLSRQYVVVPYIMLALGASVGTLVPGTPRQSALPSVVESALRVMIATIATMMVVYGMVRTMGAW
jgi:O-antigen ligase